MARLLYFAWVRERIGKAEETLSLPETVTTVAQLLDFLRGRDENYDHALKKSPLHVSVNQRHAQLNDPIKNEDEIAVFPPVSGGS